MANGSILMVKGRMGINIVFRNSTFIVDIFILLTNFAGPVIRGADFSSKYHVQLDFFQ